MIHLKAGPSPRGGIVDYAVGQGHFCRDPRQGPLSGRSGGLLQTDRGTAEGTSPGGWCVPGQRDCTQKLQTPWRATVSPSPAPLSSKTAVLRFLPSNYRSSPFQRCLGAHFLSPGLPHQARRSLQPTYPLVRAPRAVWGTQVTLPSEWVWKAQASPPGVWASRCPAPGSSAWAWGLRSVAPMSTVSSEHGRRGPRRALSAGHTAAGRQATPQLSPRSPGPDKLLAVFHQ